MTDRMKEALFSALGEVGGLRVLDLYAGSGSLGLEALSRGAKFATFIENGREAIVKLEQNIEETRLGSDCEVQWADVVSTLQRGTDERVDLVFVDPPYSNSADSVMADLEAIVMYGWLSDEGRVVLHRPAKERDLKPLGLQSTWTREYGQASLTIFCHEDEE